MTPTRTTRRSSSTPSLPDEDRPSVAGSAIPVVEPVVWPPRSPSARLVEILREGLADGESLTGPEGRWAVHG